MRRIVYLHGFASGPTSNKARYFKNLLEAAGARVDIPDLNAGDFENLTITGQLDAIARVAQDEPIALMGSSMGGYLAALYAARHPEVERLVLLAPAFGFARHWAASLGTAAVDQWRCNGWMETFHYGENRLRRLNYSLLEDGLRYEEYPDFKQPALIFHGTNDTVVPAALSEEFAAQRPNVQLQVLASDHGLLNALEEIAPQVTAFLISQTPLR